MPRVVFRCDASPAIGSGHVARCMALAHALRERGARIELVARDLGSRIRELLVEPTGARVHDLAAAIKGEPTSRDCGPALKHADWLAVPQKLDAAQTRAAIETAGSIEWLIVDHYALDARWERALRPVARKILVIDDLADRDHDCDALLDQNFFLDPERRYDNRVPRHAERMLGPRYALLRGEFARARTRLAVRTGRLQRIFVCFGGFDSAHQTTRALEAIERAGLDDVELDVVIASNHPARRQIETLCARRPQTRLCYDASTIAELMAPADLAIGASGIMNWERASLALPAIVTSVAENQHIVARDLARDRACIYLGRADDWTTDTLAGLLRGLRGTPSLLLALSERTGALTDGDGARRVAARLLPDAITLRRATAADCDAVHAWRNDEQTRRQSLDTAAIPLDQHRRWFSRVIDDPAVALLIGERQGNALGVLRYDIDDEQAIVSVYLVPGRYGQGLGTALLGAGTAWIREHRRNVKKLVAHIRGDNQQSLHAFTKAGYTLATHTCTLDIAHE